MKIITHDLLPGNSLCPVTLSDLQLGDQTVMSNHLVEVVSTGSSVKDLKEAIEKARQIPTPLGSRETETCFSRIHGDVVDRGTTWEVVV